MSKLFRGLGLLLAITCVVWVAVIWHWQGRDAAQAQALGWPEVLRWFVLLPLVLFVFVLLVRWAVVGFQQRAAAAPEGAGLAAGLQGGAQAVATPAPPRDIRCQWLAGHVCTAAGRTIQDLLAAAEADEPRPDLDPALRDDDGLPVFTARMADLEVTALATELEALADGQGAALPGAKPVREHVVRALALMEEPLADAIASLAPWAALLGGLDEGQECESPPVADGAWAPRVRLLVSWPADATPSEQAVAGQWLQGRLLRLGDGVVALHRWAWAKMPAAATGSVANADTANSASADTGSEASEDEALLWGGVESALEAFVAKCESRSQSLAGDLLLVLACHSGLSEDAVAQMQAQGRLFTAHHSKGRIPGEAAAAIVLAPEHWPADPKANSAPVLLHRVVLRRRSRSVDQSRRAEHGPVQHAAQAALAVAQVPAEAVKFIASDADQHSARGAELFAAMLALFPSLDPSLDQRMFGHLCGHVGPAAPLLGVALAAQWVQQEQASALALSLAGEHWRSAVLVGPAPAAPQGVADPPLADGSPAARV